MSRSHPDIARLARAAVSPVATPSTRGDDVIQHKAMEVKLMLSGIRDLIVRLPA